MDETWISRDLPVLRAIGEIYEDTGSAMGPDAVESATGFDAKVVQCALRAHSGRWTPSSRPSSRSWRG